MNRDYIDIIIIVVIHETHVLRYSIGTINSLVTLVYNKSDFLIGVNLQYFFISTQNVVPGVKRLKYLFQLSHLCFFATPNTPLWCVTSKIALFLRIDLILIHPAKLKLITRRINYTKLQNVLHINTNVFEFYNSRIRI